MKKMHCDSENIKVLACLSMHLTSIFMFKCKNCFVIFSLLTLLLDIKIVCKLSIVIFVQVVIFIFVVYS